jgi:hypothetical protein
MLDHLFFGKPVHSAMPRRRGRESVNAYVIDNHSPSSDGHAQLHQALVDLGRIAISGNCQDWKICGLSKVYNLFNVGGRAEIGQISAKQDHVYRAGMI